MTSTQWVEYHVGTKRKSYNTLPTSNITAEAVTVDGFTLSQTDNAGVTTTAGRSYTATGMIQTRTDGRNNTTTTVTDMAGRVLTVTDAMGNVTTTVYDSAHDLPATVTDAQGNTTCYRYDARGRKVAEWGTEIQPVCFGYDDADRMVTLTTFRAGTETVSTDPSDRTDGDTTTWSHHNASGMETAKTYADNTSAVKTYDAYNRPVSFTNTETNTVIECAYDHMGRRATKKVTIDGEVTLHQRYLYRGYLQIACCDLTRSAHPCLWLITWDPAQPIATRPLAIQKDGTWYSAPARLASQDSRSQVCSRLGVWLLKSHPAYGWDLTKNICELYTNSGSIRTSYTNSPYGSVTESGNTWQPIQWSSEYNDTELGMVYYNYRHYNPQDGRWLGRDFVMDGYNSYLFMNNGLCNKYDFLGLISTKLNETSCEFRLTLHWKIKFIPSMGNHKWNESEKYLWLNNAKNLVSNYFNVSHNFKCYSNDDCCNICKNGIKVDVVINEKPTKFKLDFLVIVYKNKRIRSEASKSLGLVRFNQDDINEKTLRNKYKQITLLHETGHMLGLSHPGQSGKKKASPGSEIDYEIDAESLMGFGNKLRLNDFQKAFCNRISKSMKKRYNKAQGNSSCSNPYEHCQKWIAK